MLGARVSKRVLKEASHLEGWESLLRSAFIGGTKVAATWPVTQSRVFGLQATGAHGDQDAFPPGTDVQDSGCKGFRQFAVAASSFRLKVLPSAMWL